MTKSDNLLRNDLEADNRRLRALLDQRDAPSELRHRLQSTLAMLRVIIRRSAETNRNLDAYIDHLEDRVAVLARAQATIDERGLIELHDLIVDELMEYQAQEGERLFLSGPNVYLKPRAGQVLALAIHELAVNAVEHGALSKNAGTITVSWNVISQGDESELTIGWKETGMTGVRKGVHEGFGTEVLIHSLKYELNANSCLFFEDDGLRCTLRFALTDKTGRVGIY